MKVRDKLTAGFLAIIVLMWVSVLFASQTYRSIHNEFEALQEDIIPGALVMAEMSEKIEAVRAWSFAHMIVGNAERRGKTVEEWLQENMQSLETLAKEHTEQSFVLIPDEAKTVQEMEDRMKQINPIIMRLVDMKDQGAELDELETERNKTLSPILAPLQTQIAEHKAEYMAELVKSAEAVREAYTTGMVVLFIAVGVTGLMAVVIALLVTRSITNPLHALHRGTEVIGEGNLYYKVGTKAKDEIGQLSRAFDRMTEGLRDNTVTIHDLNKEIAERRRAEEKLQRSEEHYRTAVQTALDGYWVNDLEGLFLDVNDSYCQIIGYSREELLGGMSISDIEAAEEPEVTAGHIRHIFEYGYDRFETRHRRKDGKVIDIEISATHSAEGEGRLVVFIRDITERKRAEVALKESRRRFADLVNLLPVSVWETDLEGNFTFVNRRGLEWAGVSTTEEPGRIEAALAFIPEDHERVRTNIQRVLNGEDLEVVEYTQLRMDGSTFPVQVIAAPIIKEGKPAGLRGVTIDITERKRAEVALKENRRRFADLVNLLPVSVWETDLEGNFTFVNRRGLEWAGVSATEDLSTVSPVKAGEVAIPDDRERQQANSRKIFEGEDIGGVEYTNLRADGSTYPVQVYAVPVIQDGELVGLRGVTIDITERKRAEEELRRSEESLRTYLEAAPDAIYINDLNGVFLYGNKKAEQITGYSREELLGKSFLDLNLLPSQYLEKAAELLAHNEAGKPTGPDEFELTGKDGCRVWVEISTTTISQGENTVVLGFVHDITGRKRAEEKLQTREQYFRSLIENASDVFMGVKADGTLDYISPSYERVMGYGIRERVGVGMFENLHPDDITDVVEGWERLLETPGSTSAMQIRARHEDGSWRHLEGTGKNLLDDPAVEGVIVTIRDVTERNRVQEQLLRLSSVVDSATEAIAITDMEGRITDCNLAWVEMTGYEKEETIGKTTVELCMAEEDLPRMLEAIAMLVSGKPVPTSDYTTRCKDGTRLTTSVNLSLLKNRQGELYGMAAIIRDVTEQRQVEVAYRQVAEKYRTILEEMEDSYFEVDLEGNFTFVNDAHSRILGYSREETIGMNSRTVTFEEDSEYVLNAYSQAYLTGNPVRNLSFRMVGKSGEIGWTEVSAVPLWNQQGEVTGFRGIGRNVSDRRRTEEELARKAEELEAASQAKSEFLASMSHELRTPLNAVIGFSELLIDGIPGEVNEEQKECLEDILTSGRHLLTLISDVLDISKVEAGKMELRPQNLDLSDVIDEVVQTIKPMADESKHKVVFSVPDDLPEAYADAGKVKQVLLNFLSNAVKFTPAGGRITVEATTTDGYCQVSVIDTGIGIKEEDLERVFEVFVQGEALPDSTRKGTGLGLALAKQFVELMEGRIWVESEYGKGSRFSFTIPRATDGELRPGAAEEAEEKPSVVAGSSTLPHQKEVLVVDDDRKARSILRAWLEQEGYVVFEATNAEGGIKGAKELHPAVIVLDIMMPGKDGWQVLRELKSIPETRDIPVVITSMLSEEELGFSLGAADYFTKPVDKERFLRKVAELGVTVDTTILVVDDNPADAHLVASMLKSDHIGALCAYSGADGVRMANETKPDLIVLDLMMPDMNGFEVVDELRGQESTSGIPIFILTAKDLVDEDLEALRQKTTAVIRKSGFTRESFLSDVKKVLGIDDEQG